MATKTQPTDQVTVIAQARVTHGTRAVNRLRKTGFVPGIVYGKGLKTPASLQISRGSFIKLLHERRGELGLVMLRIETDKKPWEHAALVQRIEHDPVNGDIVHVDFHAIELTERIRVKVPVVLNGTPVGVKQDGGLLEHFLREIEVECLPTAIPKHVDFDVSAMKITDLVHVKDLVVPADVRVMNDADQVVASVLAPKVEKPEEAAAAADAATEPEVIREKKPKEGEEAETEGKGKAEDKKDDKK